MPGFADDGLGQVTGCRCVETATCELVQVIGRPTRLPRTADGTGYGALGGEIEFVSQAGEVAEQLSGVKFRVVVGTKCGVVQRRGEAVEEGDPVVSRIGAPAFLMGRCAAVLVLGGALLAVAAAHVWSLVEGSDKYRLQSRASPLGLRRIRVPAGFDRWVVYVVLCLHG